MPTFGKLINDIILGGFCIWAAVMLDLALFTDVGSSGSPPVTEVASSGSPAVTEEPTSWSFSGVLTGLFALFGGLWFVAWVLFWNLLALNFVLEVGLALWRIVQYLARGPQRVGLLLPHLVETRPKLWKLFSKAVLAPTLASPPPRSA